MKSVQIIGPYFTNYSFAKANRGLAIALDELKEFEVNLWCPPDRIDWLPSEGELKQKPLLDKLVLRSPKHADIAIYTNTPKSGSQLHDLAEIDADVIIPYIPWEESIYPKAWVDEINQHAHAVMAISTFTAEILKKSGVKLPIIPILIGIDEEIRTAVIKKFPLKTSKSVKFLHISTARERKGIDVMLKAYFQAFKREDDVCLVIKSFPNPNNLVEKLLGELKRDDSAEVIHISDPNLTDAEIASLVNSCDATVYPSRAEGFGLPIAESMLLGVPTICTNYGGQLDFANANTASLIDYELAYAKNSEMINIGAKWAEPSVDSLKLKLKETYQAIQDKKQNLNSEFADALTSRIEMAQRQANELTWKNTAKEVKKVLNSTHNLAKLKTQKFAIIGPVNTQDGIAEYGRKLADVMSANFDKLYYIANSDAADKVLPDSEYVKRLWQTGETDFSQTLNFIQEEKIQNVLIHYHSGSFYPIEGLDNLISKLTERNIGVLVDLHSVKGEGFDHIASSNSLKKATKVIIHNQKDFEYASTKLANLELIKLATESFPKRSQRVVKQQLGLEGFDTIICTHGLMNVNKNVALIFEAFVEFQKQNPNSLFLSLNAVSPNNIHSGSELKRLQDLIKKSNLEDNSLIISEFLDHATLGVLLSASNVIVLAYSDAGESASAAVRTCLASHKIVVISSIPQFSEFESEVIKIKDVNVSEILQGIQTALEISKSSQILQEVEKFLKENSFDRKALEILELLERGA